MRSSTGTISCCSTSGSVDFYPMTLSQSRAIRLSRSVTAWPTGST